MRHAFTSTYAGIARVLHTRVKVCAPPGPGELIRNDSGLKEYAVIWDTGATNSGVTKKVVDELGLKPTGLVEVRHADGRSTVNTYLVAIALPNGVAFNEVRVSEVKLIAEENLSEENQAQLLIGMDIIGAGDFAVTNVDGITALSFQIPSSERIDFVPRANLHNQVEAINKNRASFGGHKKRKNKKGRR